jgi:hypothetical protein
VFVLFYFVIRHEDIEITPNIANAKRRMNAGPNIEPKKEFWVTIIDGKTKKNWAWLPSFWNRRVGNHATINSRK